MVSGRRRRIGHRAVQRGAGRDGKWKLIYFYGDGSNDGEGCDPRVELYDLSTDLGEENNLLQ